MAESKALEKIAPKTYALATMDEKELKSVIEVNLAGESGGLTEFDLVRASVPSGGGKSFKVEAADGQSESAVIEGVIVCHQNRRAFYEQEFGGEGSGGPPSCWSPDGVTGYGSEAAACGGSCVRCKWSQYGTATKNGKPGRGQKCQQKKTLFLVPKDSILPMVISLPPTSLGAFKAYIAQLISKRIPITGIVTAVSLEVAKNKGGQSFSECRFKAVATLAPEEEKTFRAFGELFGKLFRPTPRDGQQITVNGEEIDTSTGEVIDEDRS